MNLVLPSQRIKQQKPSEMVFASTNINEESKIKAAIDIKQIETDETLVGKGIANALKVFRERGMLGAKNAIQKGRTLDQTLEKQMAGFEKKDQVAPRDTKDRRD
jgi:hypothetical protein